MDEQILIVSSTMNDLWMLIESLKIKVLVKITSTIF